MRSVAFLACSLLSVAEAHKPNIVELAESVKDLSTLVSAVVAADLADTLSSPGPFTVFAPTNAAFGALPSGTLDNLMKPENKAQLADILTYHVASGQFLAKDLDAAKPIKTVEGKSLYVQTTADSVQVGPLADLKTVTSADNLASNGAVHIIDGVLLPSEVPSIVELAESVKDLSTLVSAVVAADLVDTLSSPGPFTVFAPTNAAFGALPAGTLDDLMKPANKGQLTDILTYHVLSGQYLVKDLDLFQPVNTVEGKPLHIQKWGGQVQVGPSLTDLKKVTGADNQASNGAVHIIDGVLLPPSSLSANKFEASATPNIVQLAESVKDLSTLVSAVVAADLADTLSSPGPFTVFAPTNEAFAALPPGTLDDLMKPESKATLADILTYHVLSGKFLVKDFDLFQPVKTVEGKPLHIQKWNDAVQVGPSLADLKHVTGADNMASNGAVHIIDGVLLPPNKLPNIVELAESVKDLSTLVSAVVAADLADTLSSPGPFTVFAPTNEAFAALPPGTLDDLMKPESKATLADILTFHVLPGQFLVEDLDLFQPVKTVEGKPLHIQKWGGKVQVGPSLTDLKHVTAADNLASNGAVHIIDGVLLPPSSMMV